MSTFSDSTERELLGLKEHGAPAAAILKEIARVIGEPEAIALAARPAAGAGPLSEREKEEKSRLLGLALRNALDEAGSRRLASLLDRNIEALRGSDPGEAA